ncbi:hypothetical protein ABT340_13310 [Streptosporangium sp. NPDC000239]|uniref:hypothetical protein n=1 Tax=Streptosporangium sp. NPDC000239 TaxID=3154248 RepID=UPI00332C584E
MSKQTTFTLTFLAGLSVIVPGCAGYLSARMDAVERAHRELVSLESRIRQERLISPVVEAEDSPARFRNETVAVPGVTLCGPGERARADNRRERGAGTLADGARTPDATSDGRPGIVSGARVSASAGASAGTSVTEAAQARAAEREQRRRHRQERLCAAAQEEPAADAPAGTSGGASDRASDGAPADPVSGSSQAEAPAN